MICFNLPCFPLIFSQGYIKLVICFIVSPGQPSSIADDAEFVTLAGSGQDAANLINQKEIHWGVSQLLNYTHIYLLNMCIFLIWNVMFTDLFF